MSSDVPRARMYVEAVDPTRSSVGEVFYAAAPGRTVDTRSKAVEQLLTAA